MTRAPCDADHRRSRGGAEFRNDRVIMTDVAPILPPAGGWPQVVVTARGCAALGPVARASSTYKGVPHAEPYPSRRDCHRSRRRDRTAVDVARSGPADVQGRSGKDAQL